MKRKIREFLNKDNGEPTNFTRWYEINTSSEIDPVDISITFVTSPVDERNGLTYPTTYSILRHVNPWTKYATTQDGNTLTATGVEIPEGYSDWIISNQDPIVIKLVSFNASSKDGAITISWETESEINNAGFNIYRSKKENEGYNKINAELILATGNATKGAKYEYIDFPGENAQFYYKLEDVSLDGKSTLSSAISVELVTGILTRLAPPKEFMLWQNKKYTDNEQKIIEKILQE